MIISENFNVWGGPRPVSLKDVQAQGIKRIISLESGIYQAVKVYENDRDQIMYQFPCEFGMAEYNMPMSGIQMPDRTYVAKIIKLCKDKTPTFIHCEKGQDRTGFVGAVLKMYFESFSYEQALTWWKMYRHPLYFIWDQELEHWAP